MAQPAPRTIGESLYWSYANLAMWHAMLDQGAEKPGRLHFMIRARLYSGLRKGTLNLGAYFDDEKIKLSLTSSCWYCGSTERLSADHIVPRQKGGRDGGENLVYACRTCNSSKGSKDLLEWMSSRGQFPSLLLLRRYLKMAIEYCRQHELVDVSLEESESLKANLPFSLDLLPHQYPPAGEMVMCMLPRPDQPLPENPECLTDR